MKKFVLCVLALLPLAAQAGKITMSTPDEQELKRAESGFELTKKSTYSFTLVTRSQ